MKLAVNLVVFLGYATIVMLPLYWLLFGVILLSMALTGYLPDWLLYLISNRGIMAIAFIIGMMVSATTMGKAT